MPRTATRALRALSYLLVLCGCEPVARATLVDGSHLLLDARSRTESGALWTGVYDEGEIAFLRSCLEPDAVFVDIGANVGLVTVPIGRTIRHLGGHVIAVEPVPVNAARLQGSLALNGLEEYVEVVPAALGASEGTIEIEKEGAPDASGNARVVLDRASARMGQAVPVLTLDSVIEERHPSRVDVMKIDVEGFEVPVLMGAQGCIERFRPVVYGEFNNVLMPMRGYSFLDVWSLFEPRDYLCFAFAHGGRLTRIVSPEPDRGNVVLAPNERSDALLSKHVKRSANPRLGR
jgi:FkbM family methyltransferase